MLAAALLLLNAQTTPGDKVAAAVAENQKTQPMVGISIAVIQSGRAVLSTGYGFENQAEGIKASSKTVYRLASISKTITAVCVMQLVEQGKLNLDAPITDSVPEWPQDKPKITLRQILSHTSGIRHYQPGKPDATFEHMTTAQSINRFKDDPLLFNPGEKYSYSTHAFTVAARAVETASGMSFQEYVDKNIRAKLGTTTLNLEDLTKPVVPNRSICYQALGNPPKTSAVARLEDNSWKYGGGGFESSAADLAKYGRAVLDAQLLGKSSRDAMWTPDPNGPNKSYALGWALPSPGVLGHGGAQQGCRTMLVIHPQSKTVVVVMSNVGAGSVDDLARKVLEIYSPGATKKP